MRQRWMRRWSSEHRSQLRGGDLAALPLLKRFGVSAAARASAYFYNTTAEIDRLVDALADIA
jgi:cysteine desulfurase / selenocysteine lyase